VDEEKGLTWRESDGHCRARLDIDEGWRWMADSYAAFVKKYGSEAKIAHITMGEYFPGNSGVPPSVDLQLFETNVKKVWHQVIAAAPKGAAGNRIKIVQANPITFGGDVTADDMATIGIAPLSALLTVTRISSRKTTVGRTDLSAIALDGARPPGALRPRPASQAVRRSHLRGR
jgi:hypothetical protein